MRSTPANEPFVYNPNEVIITVNGIALTGLGEDMVEFAFDNEQFETAVGALGDVVINENNNHLATLTLTLQASSPQYSTCLSYAKQGTIFPVWVTNASVGERCGGTKARFKKTPDVAYGGSLEDRSLEIQIFDGIHETC